MSEVIEGKRSTVEVGEVPEWGWAWRCLGCKRTAGMPDGLGSLSAPFPGQEEARRGARAHAERVCVP